MNTEKKGGGSVNTQGERGQLTQGVVYTQKKEFKVIHKEKRRSVNIHPHRESKGVSDNRKRGSVIPRGGGVIAQGEGELVITQRGEGIVFMV